MRPSRSGHVVRDRHRSVVETGRSGHQDPLSIDHGSREPDLALERGPGRDQTTHRLFFLGTPARAVSGPLPTYPSQGPLLGSVWTWRLTGLLPPAYGDCRWPPPPLPS